MTTRKQIRDTLAQMLEPVLHAHDPRLQVYPFKKARPDRSDPIICVYLEEADIVNGIDFDEDAAELTIHILAPDRDYIDDQLDAIGEPCETVMKNNPLLDGLLTSQLHTGWKYERDLIPGWVGLTHTYRISW